MIHKAKSMKEALELANKFKEDGTYDLFRGQALGDWKVISSFCRISIDLKEQHIEKITKFYSFCKNNDLLRIYIASNQGNDFIAIAQHYGFGTNFVDFTSCPEIAMYFATHDMCCEIGKESVIVCLNKREFEHEVNNGFSHFLLTKHNLPIPSIIEADLTNLWRLKAQKGCFLKLPFTNYDRNIYDFDRIYFPYSEPFNGILESDIYPERKSPIEIELDKFFMDMRMIENTKIINEIMKNIPNAATITIDTKPSVAEYNIIFKDFSTLQKHYSWEAIDSKWDEEKQIKWKYQTNRDQIQVDVQKLINSDSAYFNQLVNMIAKHRNTLINIEIINVKNLNPKISEKLKIMYDGMDVLPYSNVQIAGAIRELLNIELHFNEIDKVEVEFNERSNGKGYYTRSFIFEQDYQYLLREDILEYINSEYLYFHYKNENSEDIKKDISKSTIGLGCDIRLISDFNKFIDLFAIRIIPFQIYLNRNPILFNPIKIKTFGIP